MEPLRWGILGAAKFAREHMGPALHLARGSVLTALGTQRAEAADAFAALVPGIRVHDSYEAVLADEEVDAVYIPLPNAMHVDWTLRALAAGKHVLCEKPIAMQAEEIDGLIAARDASGLLAAEAFMIVHHPQFARARELVQGGAIGRLRHVQAVFSFYNDDLGNIRNQPGQGGGGLADIGVYVFGGARFVTGQEPCAIRHAHIEMAHGVDVFAQVAAAFEGFSYGATVSIRMAPRQELVFHGEAGVLRLSCPFNAGVFDQAELHLETEAGVRRVERFANVNQYVLQVEAFSRSVREGVAYACPLEFSRGTQMMIDMTWAASGLRPG